MHLYKLSFFLKFDIKEKKYYALVTNNLQKLSRE